MRPILFSLVLATVTAAPLAAGPPPTPPLRARLLTDHLVASPGDRVRVGVALIPAPGWHVYWKNPGEAGLATRVTWDLPPEVRAAPARWPTPRRITEPGEVTVFAYDEPALITRELRVPRDLRPAGSLRIRSAVRWLACKDACVPGAAELSGSLPLGPAARAAPGALFEAAAARAPREAAALAATRSGPGRFVVEVPGEPADYFPDPGHPEGWLAVAAVDPDAGRTAVTLKGSPPPPGGAGPALVVAPRAGPARRHPLTLPW